MPHFPPPRATDRDGKTVLTFPYHPELIAAIKRDIAPYARSYDPDSKAWTICGDYRQRAVALLLRYFPAADVPPARRFNTGPRHHSTPPPPRTAGGSAAHLAALCVTPDAPPEIVRAVYRTWCKLCHPDALPAPERGRAHRRMVEINGAYEALRAEGKA